MKKGLVHIYTGNGKGKTTAAIGLGLRAYGRGFKVLLVQFLKNEVSGEVIAIEKLGEGFRYFRNKKVEGFTWTMSDEEKEQLKKSEQEAMEYALREATSAKWDMVILDEVLGSISSQMVSIDDLVSLINNKPESMELVMTGRDAPDELIKLADYVSKINAVKHPFEKGITGRIGIED